MVKWLSESRYSSHFVQYSYSELSILSVVTEDEIYYFLLEISCTNISGVKFNKAKYSIFKKKRE